MALNTENLDFKYLMRNQSNINIEEKSDKVIEYDFKIVSFKIGNEFYGIDIMSVKEILKESKFTRVPNTLDFVIGVYNLRGDIIPVIDLAIMFNLKSKTSQTQKNSQMSIIVIKVENLLIGLVVEQILRVIPLRKSDIQPPSPLLGTINERYITGVAEVDEKLFVIFDTNEIFSAKEKGKKEVFQQSSDLTEDLFTYFCNQIEQLSDVHINEYNKLVFRKLFTDYANENKITEMTSITKEQSDSIIKKFYSKHTGELWKQPYVDQFSSVVLKALESIFSDEIRILIVGCGNGHEALSLYFMIDKYFEGCSIRMVAADINLSSVSNAAGFEISKGEIPSWINKDKYFMKLDNDTYKIKKEINNKIYFEFHDAKNISTYNREFDIVIARDLSLNLSEEAYRNFLNDVSNKIILNGILVIEIEEMKFEGRIH
jgi:purine-binding chemotaxis protein CheW